MPLRKILTKKNIGPVVHNIVMATCEYLKDNPGINSLILGLSGGADSALVGILAKAVCDHMSDHENREIKLIVRSLPIRTNTAHERSRSMMLGKLLTQDFREVELNEEYGFLAESLADEEVVTTQASIDQKIRLGNIKARIRMIYLYNLASIHQGMVLSTDNFSELLLGFWTLHGDVGDFGMVQNLWKTEVFLMLEYLAEKIEETGELDSRIATNLRLCRNAVPTDGLGITTSDLDQFGDVKSYEEVDKIFFDILKNGSSTAIDNGKSIPHVIKMFNKTMYKRNNPYNIPRDELINIK